MSDLSKTIGKAPDWEGIARRHAMQTSKYKQLYIETEEKRRELDLALTLIALIAKDEKINEIARKARGSF